MNFDDGLWMMDDGWYQCSHSIPGHAAEVRPPLTPPSTRQTLDFVNQEARRIVELARVETAHCSRIQIERHPPLLQITINHLKTYHLFYHVDMNYPYYFRCRYYYY